MKTSSFCFWHTKFALSADLRKVFWHIPPFSPFSDSDAIRAQSPRESPFKPLSLTTASGQLSRLDVSDNTDLQEPIMVPKLMYDCFRRKLN